VFAADPKIAFACCRPRSVDEADPPGVFLDTYLRYEPQRWTTDFCDDGQNVRRSYFWRYNPIANASAVVLMKNIYEQSGGADETLRYCGN
jgi:hypothetical protein